MVIVSIARIDMKLQYMIVCECGCVHNWEE
jgi:hypothetical protein